MMTRAQTVAVATAVQQCRPEWDHAGIVAALEKASTLGTPAEVAAAACRLAGNLKLRNPCLLYTSPSPRDRTRSRMPSSA